MRGEHADEEACENWYFFPLTTLSGLNEQANLRFFFVSGDKIIVVVQKARSFDSGPNASSAASSTGGGGNKVKRGDIRHAVVVRTAKKLQRKDGMVVRFDDNACVLIGKSGEPIGTRVTGAC